MARRSWYVVLVASAALALVSLASNITTVSQLSGESNVWWTLRGTLSKVVNAGTAWAGLLILSGWLVRRPAQAAAAGITAGLTALVVHYGVGQLFGVSESSVFADNAFWFVAAIVVGGPMGLIGAAARRQDLWGLLARLVVPVAAVVEPILLGMFTTSAIYPWPDRVSSVLSGLALVVAGTVGGAVVVARRAGRRRTPQLGRARPGHAGPH